MITKEADIYRLFKDKIKQSGTKNLLIFKVESGSTMRGLPDLFIATRRNSGWMELKVLYKITEPITPKFRPGQLPLIRQLYSINVPVLLCTYIGQTDKLYFHYNHDIQMQYQTFDAFTYTSSFALDAKNLDLGVFIQRFSQLKGGRE